MSCVAIGSMTPERTTGNSPGPSVILTEQSERWTTVAAPLPATVTTGSTILKAVACAALGQCVIVGTYKSGGATTGSGDRGQHADLLTEANGTWSSGATPLPANAAAPANPSSGSELDAVSCSSPRACVAVGSYVASSGDEEGLILTEGPSGWTPTAASLNVEVTKLNGVSCTATGSCTAVGTFDNNGTPLGLVLTERSGSWHASTPPHPATLNGLYGVSCPKPTACLVAGVYLDSSYDQRGLILSGSAARWRQQPAPMLADEPTDPGPGLGTTLSAVSCSGGRCVVVGTYVVSASRERGIFLEDEFPG